MKRREFFGFAVSSAVVFESHLQGDCHQMNGYQACSSTVDIDEASREQECDEFCWAACMQMIFALNGHTVSQESIVRQALQIPNDVTDICVPIGSAPNFRKALSRTYKDDDGKRFKVHIKAFFDSDAGLKSIDNQDVVDALDAGRALIYCNRTHAMVNYRMDYQDGYAGMQRIKVWVVDPLTGGKRMLSPTEILPAPKGSMTFVADVVVTDL